MSLLPALGERVLLETWISPHYLIPLSWFGMPAHKDNLDLLLQFRDTTEATLDTTLNTLDTTELNMAEKPADRAVDITSSIHF